MNNGIAAHDVDLAAEWAEQVLVLKEGRTLAQGEPSLLADEQLVREAELRFPVVTRIFRSLPELKPGPLPITVIDAVTWIKNELRSKDTEGR